MASSYPGGIDSLTNPAPSDSMAVVLHSSQHADANDAIEAIETELGTNPSGASATVKDRLDTLVVGPGSATDNALVRFDGTGGKTVQDSGITVDDSGNVSSNLTMSKASPIFRVNGSSGSANIYVDRVAGSSGYVNFRTGTSWRWEVGVSATAESGSNAGSNLLITRYNDAGAGGTGAVLIYRDTGKVLIGSVGATAGLELGASGPRVMSGTGSPEGVVSAPVGSQWIDTAATTGAIRWIKASGTGSTGWAVDYGDTGRRDIASLANSIGTLTLSSLVLRRIGSLVSLEVSWADSQTNPNSVALVTLPAEFRPNGTHYFTTPYDSSSSTAVRNLRVSAGSGIVYYGGATNASGFVVNTTWATSSTAWPSSLPGSAA